MARQDDIAKPTRGKDRSAGGSLLESILGRKVLEGEPLSHEDVMTVARHVMRENRSALAALAKS